MTTAAKSCPTAGATGNAADLLARASDGDPTAWEEVVRQYGNLVLATVRSFRLQEADALDAVQTTWLRLAENAHHVLWPERLAGWLVTTARHECLRILRQAKSAPDPIDRKTVADTVADPSVGPEQQVIEADAARTLWSLVEELPPRQRTLLRALFTDHPRPYAEIARAAGIPPGAIGPTRKRALQQLRGRLDELGLGRRPAGKQPLPCRHRALYEVRVRHEAPRDKLLRCTPTAHKRVCDQPASSKVVSVALSKLLT
ncbi:MAG: sigma-70 family RNA polymerase sigma factor [Pseudonocardiales bacterium]|nr:sigma-70 family RNA polymerase sigma factor [Pseudonocardiales bacterium]